MGLIKVVSKQFDDFIRPVGGLLTSDGVQYATLVENQTESYKDVFDINSDTQFSCAIGFLSWVKLYISFIVWSVGPADPTVTYKVEIKEKTLVDWITVSVEETYLVVEHTEVAAANRKLEGYIMPLVGIEKAPFGVRLRFKSSGTASADKIFIRLKNDTYIRPVGVYSLF